MSKLKIVQIGVGHDHADVIYKSLRKQTDLFEVMGHVVLPGEEPMYNARMAAYAGTPSLTVEEALAIPGLDAAAIETDDWNLVKYAQMAADAGLHVTMDKPGSESPEDFERVLSTVKAHGRVFAIEYMYRYNPAVCEALELARAGKLGELYAVEAQMNCDLDLTKRDWLGHFQGGMTFYLGCHLADLIVRFMGVPEAIIPFNQATGIDGRTATEFGMAVFKYPNGCSFLKTCGAEVGGYPRRQLVVAGSRGTIEIKPLEMNVSTDCVSTLETERVFYHREGTRRLSWRNRGEYRRFTGFDRYDDMMRDFAEKVARGPSTDEELAYEAMIHRVVLAACGIDCDFRGEIKL